MKENSINEVSRTDWAFVDALDDDTIDPSDAPPMTEERLARFVPRYPSPVKITLSLDPTIADWFEAQGEAADKQMVEAVASLCGGAWISRAGTKSKSMNEASKTDWARLDAM